MNAARRWRGVIALAFDGLEHGSRAIERVHVETARRVFVILEALPPTAPVSRLVRVTHDATVAAVHGAIRMTGRLARAGALRGTRAGGYDRRARPSPPCAG